MEMLKILFVIRTRNRQQISEAALGTLYAIRRNGWVALGTVNDLIARQVFQGILCVLRMKHY